MKTTLKMADVGELVYGINRPKKRKKVLTSKVTFKKLNDRKIISGKGRLTDKIINKMQNFYGMSIRQNTLAAWSGDRNKALYNMKKICFGCIVALLEYKQQ